MDRNDFTCICWYTHLKCFSDSGEFSIKISDFLEWAVKKGHIINYVSVNPTPSQRLNPDGKILTTQSKWVDWHDFFWQEEHNADDLVFAYLNSTIHFSDNKQNRRISDLGALEEINQ